MKIEKIIGILIIVVLITNMVMPSVFAIELQNTDEQSNSYQEENLIEENNYKCSILKGGKE